MKLLIFQSLHTATLNWQEICRRKGIRTDAAVALYMKPVMLRNGKWAIRSLGDDANLMQDSVEESTPPLLTTVEQLAILKDQRDAVQYAFFRYMEKSIQCDNLARANINSAAINAMTATDAQWPADFAWRCEDNTWLPLTRQQTLGMSAAFGQFLAACFAVFATKSVAIAARQSVDINTGWPV